MGISMQVFIKDGHIYINYTIIAMLFSEHFDGIILVSLGSKDLMQLLLQWICRLPCNM